jgi:hypothetical protein
MPPTPPAGVEVADLNGRSVDEEGLIGPQSWRAAT